MLSSARDGAERDENQKHIKQSSPYQVHESSTLSIGHGEESMEVLEEVRCPPRQGVSRNTG